MDEHYLSVYLRYVNIDFIPMFNYSTHPLAVVVRLAAGFLLFMIGVARRDWNSIKDVGWPQK
jgi:hypothetical protein